MSWFKGALVLCVSLCAHAADPDFTGTWKLNSAASRIGHLPVPPEGILEIRQHGPVIECGAGAIPIESRCAYKTDGSESRLAEKGITISSRTKWEGAALLISSLVSGAKSYTRMDRWTLSRDGNVLKVRRQIVDRYGETESLLIYEK